MAAWRDPGDRAEAALSFTALFTLYVSWLLLATLPGAAAAGCPFSAKWMPRAVGGLGGYPTDPDAEGRAVESVAGFQGGFHRRRSQEEEGRGFAIWVPPTSSSIVRTHVTPTQRPPRPQWSFLPHHPPECRLFPTPSPPPSPLVSWPPSPPPSRPERCAFVRNSRFFSRSRLAFRNRLRERKRPVPG